MARTTLSAPVTLCVRYRQHRHICIPATWKQRCDKYVTMLLQCCHCYHLGNVMFSYESIFNSHPHAHPGIIPMCNNLETMCRCVYTQHCSTLLTTLEQTVNRNKARTMVTPPAVCFIILCSIRSFRGRYSNIYNVHH